MTETAACALYAPMRRNTNALYTLTTPYHIYAIISTLIIYHYYQKNLFNHPITFPLNVLALPVLGSALNEKKRAQACDQPISTARTTNAYCYRIYLSSFLRTDSLLFQNLYEIMSLSTVKI